MKNLDQIIVSRQLGKTALTTEFLKQHLQSMKFYTLTHNKTSQIVTADSSLTALIEASTELKKSGQNKFALEIHKDGQRLAVWVR